MAKPLPPVGQLRAAFDYNPLTGELIRKSNNLATGTLNSNGYLITSLGRKCQGLRVHRLVWAWVTGEEPSGEIDHKNGDRTDNRFWNLRVVSHSTNNLNQRSRGYYYVHPRKGRQGYWQVSIMVEGKKHRCRAHSEHEARHKALALKRAVAQGKFLF